MRYPDPYPYDDLDPYPNRTLIPSCDADCQALIDQAVESLIILRGGSTRDPGAHMSVLASLAAEADDRIPDTVWSARTHHHYTWNLIAERLALTPQAARKRYSHYVQLRSQPPVHEQRCQTICTQFCQPMCK